MHFNGNKPKYVKIVWSSLIFFFGKKEFGSLWLTDSDSPVYARVFGIHTQNDSETKRYRELREIGKVVASI